MSDPFLSEIRVFSFPYAPRSWAFCNGQLLPISQNQALFALLGVTYGGDGRTTFSLPNLQGRVPIGFSNTTPLGKPGGEIRHALEVAEIPAHNHILSASKGAAEQSEPNPGDEFGVSGEKVAYTNNATNLVPMAADVCLPYGASAGHENMQPYLALNFCIALNGIFPSRS